MHNLSIICPCYNCIDYCDPFLNSIINQKTNYSFEVICIIDNTTDNSYNYIKSILTNNNISHKIKSVSNGSTGLSRNDGIDLAESDYIMFIDDDDWFIGEDSIQKALDFAYSNLKNPICKFGFEWSENRKNGYFIWQYIWKTDFIKENKFNDKMGGEDFDLMFRIYLKFGWDCCIENTFPSIPDKLYYYNYPREGSILGRIKSGQLIRN